MGGLLQRLAQAAEPLFAGLPALIYALVTPVGRNASLGHGIHTFGADLYLDPTPLASRNGGVQRLVTVRFGNGDPVAHAVGIGSVAVAHDRIYGPAELLLRLALAVDDDAQREDVVNPLERNVLLAHLVPNRVDRLGAALYVVADALTVDLVGDRLQETGYEGPAFALGLLQTAVDIFVIARLQPLEGQILQFALEVVESQLVSYLGIEIHALPALFAPLVGRKHLQAAHYLQTVGQLDEYHARILRIADDHVAEVVGLLFRHLQPYVRYLAQPHDDAYYLLAELGAYDARQLVHPVGILLHGDAHHVVKDGRHGGVTPEPYFARHDLGHGRVVIHHRSAVVTGVSPHAFGGEYQRLVHQLLRRGRERLADEGPQRRVFLQSLHNQTSVKGLRTIYKRSSDRA